MNTQASPTVAVQIVSYRTRSYLERCLPTVVRDLESSRIEYEINLLDNASGEDLGDLARRFDHCRTFDAPRNLGFGAGHNLLAGKTEASALLILNPDVELLAPQTAGRLLAALSVGDGVEVVGPKLIDAAGRPQPHDHGRLHGARAQLALRGGHGHWRETDRPQDVAWVSGAVLLVDRCAFVRVGGFDQNLFLYKEDEDLCLRIRRTGGRVRYEPGVVVRHHGSVVADRRAGIERASRYFFEKHSLNRRAHRLARTAHGWLGRLRL